MNGTDWLWYAAGVATAILLGIAHARLKYRRWVRRHSYVAEVEIHGWQTAVQRNDELAAEGDRPPDTDTEGSAK